VAAFLEPPFHLPQRVSLQAEAPRAFSFPTAPRGLACLDEIIKLPGHLVELQRCRDAASVEDLIRILDAAGISHRVGSDAPVIDISSIGTGNEAQAIIGVHEEDDEAARAAMEQDSLQVELPSDHDLLTSTDDEIVEIAAQPGEWSAFDVAHARRFMNERGINPARIETLGRGRLAQLREGKPAPTYLLVIGWIAEPTREPILA